ncbi:MAG: hypothetical protein IKH82_06455 [Clostridiales bacterium]|nr:hypothetical protein [Clostridiales bacterium]
MKIEPKTNSKKPLYAVGAALLATTTMLTGCLQTAGEATIWEDPTTTTTEEVQIDGEVVEPTIDGFAQRGLKDLPYEEVKLDGVEEHHFVSTDYCYLESEKYVLLIDKGIDLPGDFQVNLDAIIDELESELGLSSCPDTYEYCGSVIDISIYFDGEYPWAGLGIGTKIPIFIMADDEPSGWISNASSEGAMFVIYEMFSEEVINSVPYYRDNPEYINDYLDYTDIAHELTHVITERNHMTTEIITEGIAEYMGYAVIEELADEYPSIGVANEKRYNFDYTVPEKVNAENAERIFIDDFNSLTTAERGAQYSYGKYLFMYLYGSNGSGTYKMLNDKIIEKGIDYNRIEYSEAEVTKIAEALKETFGEDVFAKFGDWCVENNHLQTEGYIET